MTEMIKVLFNEANEVFENIEEKAVQIGEKLGVTVELSGGDVYFTGTDKQVETACNTVNQIRNLISRGCTVTKDSVSQIFGLR